MKRLGVLFVAGLVSFAGCKKSDEDKAGSGTATGSAIQHGKMEGKGTGGGNKSATGTMNGKTGSGKPVGAGTASGTAAGTGTGAQGGGDALVARGAYIATGVGACALCHTPLTIGDQGPAPDMSKAFAGGFSFKEPFGTWVSPNITPDPDTGIGKWTDDQIAAAIRTGATPDGKTLHPIMPYMFYNRMTDDDVKAVVAFLRSLPPIKNAITKGDLQGRPPQPMPAPTGNVDPKDDPVKHGEYLATLMHCGACHTPMTPKGPDMTMAFAGGNPFEFPPEMHAGTGTVYSANITSDAETGIGAYTEEDIVKALRTLSKKDGSPIFGPMQFYAGMWKNMTDEDIAAVAKYVKTIPAVKNKVPANTYKPPGPPPGGGAATGTGAASGSAVEHGKQEGKGNGGGDKAATGTKNGKAGSGKPPAPTK